MLKITNLEDHLVTITWAKQDYDFDPGETLPIADHIYHHWFGDPELLASDDMKVAREERMRVDALWGEFGIPKLVLSTEAAKLRAAAAEAPAPSLELEPEAESAEEPAEEEEPEKKSEATPEKEPAPKPRGKGGKFTKAEEPKPEEEPEFPDHPDNE